MYDDIFPFCRNLNYMVCSSSLYYENAMKPKCNEAVLCNGNWPVPYILNRKLLTYVQTLSITKTCLYNFDPLKPHFYIVKLGFTGVYITFLISAQNIDCGYSLEPPRRGGSNEYPQSMFWAEIWKISKFFIWKFSFFWVVKFSIYLNRLFFFVMRIRNHFAIQSNI